MTTRFACPACNTVMNASDSKVGVKVACPKCGQRLQIPAPPKGTILAKPLPPRSADDGRTSDREAAHLTEDTAGVIRFFCPKCMTTIEAREQQAGTIKACEHCGLRLKIPTGYPENHRQRALRPYIFGLAAVTFGLAGTPAALIYPRSLPLGAVIAGVGLLLGLYAIAASLSRRGSGFVVALFGILVAATSFICLTVIAGGFSGLLRISGEAISNSSRPVKANASSRPGEAQIPVKENESIETAKTAEANESNEATKSAEAKTKARQKIAPLLFDLNGKSPGARQKALEALGQMGPDAEAASEDVLALLADKSATVQQSAFDALEKINPALHKPILTLLVDRDNAHKIEALRQLGALGNDAAPALPTLIRYYRLQTTRESSGWLLLPATLLSTMCAIDPDNKDFQSLVISNIALQPAENDYSYAISNYRPLRIQSIGIAADWARAGKVEANKLVKPLRLALADINCQLAAIKALGDLGPAGKEALPELRRLKTDPEQTIRDAAADAVSKIE
jgi:DNA-directed RNA polymerase subunit M/transcription elongation factor TFIIS